MATEQKECGCSAPSASECEAAMMEMAKPAPEIKFLEPLVGTFDAEVKMWMGPGEPVISHGVMVNEWSLGGKWLRHTYAGDENFNGSGFFGFDKTRGVFEGLWIDTISTSMQMETGSYDEASKTWTMTSEMLCPMTKVPMKKRSVTRIESPDRHVMEMYFQSQGQPEGKGMEIAYTRKG